MNRLTLGVQRPGLPGREAGRGGGWVRSGGAGESGGCTRRMGRERGRGSGKGKGGGGGGWRKCKHIAGSVTIVCSNGDSS